MPRIVEFHQRKLHRLNLVLAQHQAVLQHLGPPRLLVHLLRLVQHHPPQGQHPVTLQAVQEHQVVVVQVVKEQPVAVQLILEHQVVQQQIQG